MRAAKPGEFVSLKGMPRYCVLQVVRDWAKGVSRHKREVIQVAGGLRWAEGEGEWSG